MRPSLIRCVNYGRAAVKFVQSTIQVRGGGGKRVPGKHSHTKYKNSSLNKKSRRHIFLGAFGCASNKELNW